MVVMNSATHRVGLNAHLLNLSGNYRSAGINWYIYHLLQQLTSSSEFTYTAFTSEPRAREHLGNLEIIQSRLPTHKPIARIFWEQFIQPIALRRAKIDLLHALAFAGPLAIATPWLTTIYDLSFARYPKSFNRANRIYLTWAVRDAVRRANRIIVISQSTKRDLVEMFGAQPEQISVVYCGVDPAFTAARDRNKLDAFRARHNLPEHMILHVGTIEPRKNIPRLIRAFAHAKRTARLPHKLVLVGAHGWKYTEVEEAIEQTDSTHDVIFAGYVLQEELPLWYQAAELFVYPSIYEGFGLPPLDAMANGVPVITSNTSSLPEVVGSAAIQVAPDDEQAIADAIMRTLSDKPLRDEMRTRGIAQAKNFSWERAAQETVAIYRSVLAKGTLNVSP